jgi:orotate phosphoribosyltransferase
MTIERCLQILRKKSVLHAPEGKPFILKSGAESMTYVDVRLTALSHEGLCRLSSGLTWRMQEMGLEPDRVAGVVVGGCPLATGVSFRTAIDVLYVRAEAKDHGTNKLIEGTFLPGYTVVLFEDVITSGGSTLGAIRTLRDAGLNVIGVVAVLDREQGGLEAIRKECPAEALYTLKELLT